MCCQASTKANEDATVERVSHNGSCQRQEQGGDGCRCCRLMADTCRAVSELGEGDGTDLGSEGITVATLVKREWQREGLGRGAFQPVDRSCSSQSRSWGGLSCSRIYYLRENRQETSEAWEDHESRFLSEPQWRRTKGKTGWKYARFHTA